MTRMMTSIMMMMTKEDDEGFSICICVGSYQALILKVPDTQSAYLTPTTLLLPTACHEDHLL